MKYVFVSLITASIMAFTTILAALLTTTVGQLVLIVVAGWIAETIFGVSVKDIPSSVWHNPTAIIDYIW